MMKKFPGFKHRFCIKKKIRRPYLVLLCLLGLSLVVCGGGYASVKIWPSLGAQGADFLRGIIGDSAVAWLESEVFQVQDALMKLEYGLGAKPAVPWSNGAANADPNSETPTLSSASPTPDTTPRQAGGTPTATATPVRWPPPNLPALGTLAGEGEWSSYFSNAQGYPVAYRTFLQPDPDRPYSIVAIVAVDLDKTRLEFVLGFTEPLSEVPVERTGIIPKQDKQPGILLATFNGGFLTRHGLFGVMVEGKTLIPMRDGLGTLAIFQDGHVQIGVWGSDITSYNGIFILRQNGPMIIQDGQINPKTNEDNIEYWGYVVGGKVATWRSAIGLSADGRTLYYVAGESVTMPALARTLKTAGVDAAIQLDINNYWVLFCAVHFNNDVPKSTPLLDNMSDNIDRYLYASARDYFYIAAKTK